MYAHLLNEQGIQATAYRLGELNNETKFVLDQLELAAPDLLGELPSGSNVALVDHNESAQSVANLSELNVTHLIDHHKLGDLSTHAPAYLRFEPVGCTATILFKMYREEQLPVEHTQALLMLSAILSDTLHFRSPTTSKADREAVEQLAAIAKISDINAYALAMFAAKSDLGDVSAEKLLKMDYKVFPLERASQNTENWGVGVIETTNPAYALGRKSELLAAMQQVKEADNLGGVLLSVVDILGEQNTTLVLGEQESKVIKGAFGAESADHCADLGQRLSRKKQIVPELKEYLSTF